MKACKQRFPADLEIIGRRAPYYLPQKSVILCKSFLKYVGLPSVAPTVKGDVIRYYLPTALPEWCVLEYIC